jgi:hypothetical protein
MVNEVTGRTAGVYEGRRKEEFLDILSGNCLFDPPVRAGSRSRWVVCARRPLWPPASFSEPRSGIDQGPSQCSEIS